MLTISKSLKYGFIFSARLGGSTWSCEAVTIKAGMGNKRGWG
jgi:hypothetical protein